MFFGDFSTFIWYFRIEISKLEIEIRDFRTKMKIITNIETEKSFFAQNPVFEKKETLLFLEISNFWLSSPIFDEIEQIFEKFLDFRNWTWIWRECLLILLSNFN